MANQLCPGILLYRGFFYSMTPVSEKVDGTSRRQQELFQGLVPHCFDWLLYGQEKCEKYFPCCLVKTSENFYICSRF